MSHFVNRIFENVVLSASYLIQSNRLMLGITTLFSFKCFRLLTRPDSGAWTQKRFVGCRNTILILHQILFYFRKFMKWRNLKSTFSTGVLAYIWQILTLEKRERKQQCNRIFNVFIHSGGIFYLTSNIRHVTWCLPIFLKQKQSNQLSDHFTTHWCRVLEYSFERCDSFSLFLPSNYESWRNFLWIIEERGGKETICVWNWDYLCRNGRK